MIIWGHLCAVWTVHCLNREKFENGEKTTRILYAHQRGKTALHVPEHSFGGSQQVHTENSIPSLYHRQLAQWEKLPGVLRRDLNFLTAS